MLSGRAVAPDRIMNRRELAIGACAALAGLSAACAQEQVSAVTRTHRLAAPRPPARFLIVLLHGYGSNAEDLFSLAADFQTFAPTAAIAAPDAPIGMGGGAYSWFTEAERSGAPAAATRAMAHLDGLLDAELARHALPAEKLILIGFSQGAVMALNTGLRRPVPPAAIIAYSGARLDPAGLPANAARPPVLLIEGAQEDRFPKGTQDAALKVLKDAGFPVQAHVLSNLGHNIDQRGIDLAGALLRKVTD
jgi:phospholipase/carboxylesterase